MDERIEEKILNIQLEDEMKKSYISYAMSVIVARALPDARDGLKPVHRRILYAMNELNLDPSKAYKKCARIVGDTMGKYHPHGDASIYDALVRMAQDWSMRYPLVDGHGNFGSLDGDSPAAQRYTEARLMKLAVSMMEDIDKETVDFSPNYDGEFNEPDVFPALAPNLLINGSGGIAVGMATNIPPHNLGEVIDGCLKVIGDRLEGKTTDCAELLHYIKGPDFPTGGEILGTRGIKQAYLTGRGKITVRATPEFVDQGGGRTRIVFREIPYQVNKAALIKKISDLVHEKRIEGISDMNDLSNREGIYIYVDVKRDANPNIVLNNLYRNTQLQDTFGVINLALVNGEPKVLNLFEMIDVFVRHREDVITRRTRFDLNKAEKRAHIVEGFLKALDFIDEIIAIIRANRDINVSKQVLIERFGFTQAQVDAIVEMRLRALSGLERERLETEYKDLLARIAYFKSILEDAGKLLGVIKDELTDLRRRYSDGRRTRIVPYEGDIELEDLINDEGTVLTISSLDYIKRVGLDTYKTQNRGGRGVVGMQTRDEDEIKDLFVVKTHDDILFVTNLGRLHKMRAFEIPEAGRQSRGTALVNLLNLSQGERVAAVIPLRDYDCFLFMVSKFGIVKKTSARLFQNVRKSGIVALNIREDDELVSAFAGYEGDEVFIASRFGMGIRFSEGDVRDMGRLASGVRGMSLFKGDYVVGAQILNEGCKILFATDNGLGKSTEVNEFRKQARGGKGVKVYKLTDKSGLLMGICRVCDSDELMLINSDGVIIRIRIADISTTGRVTQGVILTKLPEGVTLVGCAVINDWIADKAEPEGETAAEAEPAVEPDSEAEESDD